MATFLPTSTVPVPAAFGMLTRSRCSAATPPLGWQRTLLVVGHGPELAVALRDRLDRAYLTVYEVRPGEVAEAVRACIPWPWMVVGETATMSEATREALGARPVLLLWRRPAPPRLPPHLIAVQSFSAMAAAVEEALRSHVAGICLAVGSGLTMPDGAHAVCPALEALVGNHPRPVLLTPRQLRAAATVLAEHGVALRPCADAGGAVLAPAEHS